MKKLVIVTAVALALGTHAELGNADVATRYMVTDLGTLKGDNTSLALAINNSGQAVGYSYNINYATNNTTAEHAALFSTTGGANTDLGTLGGIYSTATAINDRGQIVGSASMPGDTTSHATLFSITGTANVDLGTLGGTYSSANAINNKGQMVGYSFTSDNTAWHATLFNTTGGANVDLGTLGAPGSVATAINDKGQVVGWADTPDSVSHATLFSITGGAAINLGGIYSNANAINDRGQVVGQASMPGNIYGEATLFSTTGGASIPMGASGAAVAINNNGQVVGDTVRSPFLWENGVATYLSSLIDQRSGWILLYAAGINDRGQIVGEGYNRGIGQYHAVLLTPIQAPIKGILNNPFGR